MKNKPFQYVAIWHPSKIEEAEGLHSIVHSKGIVVANSLYNAYEKVAKEFAPIHDNDAEQIEVYIKPFLDEDSCPTKIDFGNIYSYFMDNTNIIYWRNNTALPEDFIPNTFTNDTNLRIPNKMYLIDIFNLINDNKKDIL